MYILSQRKIPPTSLLVVQRRLYVAIVSAKMRKLIKGKFFKNLLIPGFSLYNFTYIYIYIRNRAN